MLALTLEETLLDAGFEIAGVIQDLAPSGPPQFWAVRAPSRFHVQISFSPIASSMRPRTGCSIRSGK